MATTVEQKPLLTVDEAARVFAVSDFTIRRWAKSGLLPAVRIMADGPLRFRPEDIERLIARSRRGEGR